MQTRVFVLMAFLLPCLACGQPGRSIDKAQSANWEANRARQSIERARNAKDTNAKIDAILDALEAMDDAQRGVSRH
jgi:hypothetical protein